MPEVFVSATVYTPGQLHTRNRRRQYQTTDGRFQLRRAGESDTWYWHPVEKQDGRTVVNEPLTGPAECFYCRFGHKAEALLTLNTLCAHYGL